MATEYDGRRVRVPKDLAARVDVARGQVPFNRWCVRALEAALRREPPSVTVPLKKGPPPEGKTFSQQTAEIGDELQAREERRSSAPAKPATEPAETPLPSIAKRRDW